MRFQVQAYRSQLIIENYSDISYYYYIVTFLLYSDILIIIVTSLMRATLTPLMGNWMTAAAARFSLRERSSFVEARMIQFVINGRSKW